MSYFTQFTSIQPIPKSNKWVTTQELIYCVGSEWSNEKIIVPVGYEFDGASVPRLFGILLQSVEPSTINAACVHDFIYTDLKNRYTLAQADYIFFEALKTTNSTIKSWFMYIGVRLWGWLYWYNIL